MQDKQKIYVRSIQTIFILPKQGDHNAKRVWENTGEQRARYKASTKNTS